MNQTSDVDVIHSRSSKRFKLTGRENVRSVRLAGAESVHFYHYGLYRERSLDWVREALAANAGMDTTGPSGSRSHQGNTDPGIG